jgi:hypothetical protein
MTARYRIIECEQGSPEWFEARRGIPTASRYADVLAEGKGESRDKYMCQLVGEILSGKPMSTYTNERMERGKEQEPDLRAKYSFEREVDIVQVGFIRSNLMSTGCSPDGLVGVDGILEIKSTEPHLLVKIVDTGKFPARHIPQIQGNLWITGRNWCDLMIGCPDMSPFITRIPRDEPYMANLRKELERFNQELQEMAARVKQKQ